MLRSRRSFRKYRHREYRLIRRLHHRSCMLPIPPPHLLSLILPLQVAHLNKARIEHEDQQRQSRKGKEKQTDFDMASVAIPDLNLASHAISSDYYDAVRIPLYTPSSPSHPPLFIARLWSTSHQTRKEIQGSPSLYGIAGTYPSILLNRSSIPLTFHSHRQLTMTLHVRLSSRTPFYSIITSLSVY